MEKMFLCCLLAWHTTIACPSILYCHCSSTVHVSSKTADSTRTLKQGKTEFKVMFAALDDSISVCFYCPLIFFRCPHITSM